MSLSMLLGSRGKDEVKWEKCKERKFEEVDKEQSESGGVTGKAQQARRLAAC